MLNRLMGWGFAFAFMPYGEAWRRRRQIIQGYFHHNMAERYRPALLQATQLLLRDFDRTSSESVLFNMEQVRK